MMLKEAKEKFISLINSLNKDDIQSFKIFVASKLYEIEIEAKCNNSDNSDDTKNILNDPVFILNSISEYIKPLLPTSAILPIEDFVVPERGENSDCSPDITVHVDEFLYSEEDVEEMIEENKLKSHYCVDCRSTNIEPLIYISHSISKKALYYIFKKKLPCLEGKVVLDVGSRLGAVLYGAYVYTNAKKIIGVEMNNSFSALQEDIISKYDMKDRIEIVNDKIEDVEDIVQAANVIILNNPFEFYFSVKKQILIWKFFLEHTRKGTILVMRPSLKSIWDKILFPHSVEHWVKPYKNPEEDVEPYEDEEIDDEFFYDFAFYEVS